MKEQRIYHVRYKHTNNLICQSCIKPHETPCEHVTKMVSICYSIFLSIIILSAYSLLNEYPIPSSGGTNSKQHKISLMQEKNLWKFHIHIAKLTEVKNQFLRNMVKFELYSIFHLNNDHNS